MITISSGVASGIAEGIVRVVSPNRSGTVNSHIGLVWVLGLRTDLVEVTRGPVHLGIINVVQNEEI